MFGHVLERGRSCVLLEVGILVCQAERQIFAAPLQYDLTCVAARSSLEIPARYTLAASCKPAKPGRRTSDAAASGYFISWRVCTGHMRPLNSRSIVPFPSLPSVQPFLDQPAAHFRSLHTRLDLTLRTTT